MDLIDYYPKEARKTALAPVRVDFTYMALGLAGEFGEVMDKLLPEKAFRNGTASVDISDITDELGDVLWYITNLGIEAGYTLRDLASDLTNGLECKDFVAIGYGLVDGKDCRSPFLLFTVHCGTICEIAKKAIRDNGGQLQASKLPALRTALGGALRAWLDLCDKYKVSPNDAAIGNNAKLAKRFNEGKIQGDGDKR